MPDLLNNYTTIIDHIKQAKLTKNADQVVTLLAVSKQKPAQMIRTLLQAGQTDFGENYLQEAIEKQKELSLDADCQDIVWHYIGSIQRNKTKDIAAHFSWVHTVSRDIIAKRLSDQRSKNLPALNVCIQVNIDEEDTKSGCLPDEAMALAQQISQYDNLCLRGLMVIPSEGNTDAFKRTKQLFDEISDVLNSTHWDTLSMGMSRDFDDAIQHGATIVRVGSAIFGVR